MIKRIEKLKYKLGKKGRVYLIADNPEEGIEGIVIAHNLFDKNCKKIIVEIVR